jgi:amino acid adenylation domain-containing protein
MLVHHFVERSAAQTPQAIAVIEPGKAISYQELDRLSNRVANALRDRGVVRGDRVLLALENSIELVASYLGVLKAGAVAVPLPPGPRSDRLSRALEDCSPSACLLDPVTAHALEQAGALARVKRVLTYSRNKRASAEGTPPPAANQVALNTALAAASPEPCPSTAIDLDLAAIIYTSGSTGAPRGVMLRHRNIVANTRSIAEYLHLTSADRAMCVLPLYYVYGLSLLHTHLMTGGSVVLDNRFTYPNVVLNAMQEHRVTGFAGVPSTFALLLHRSNLSTMEFPDLRYVTQAGGGMPPVRVLEWLERGPKVPFFVMYGATEASARLTYLQPDALRRQLGSIGKAIPQTEVVVVRDDGTRAERGEIGELVARGANIAAGYWNDPEETAVKFGPLGYRTGDLGYEDDEGYLFLVGRRHDMIKVGAHRVGATEIEDALHEHAGIHEAAVVGAPHDILGEVPVAFVTRRDAAALDVEAVRAFCAERLAPHKIPARIVVIEEMPRTGGAGKTDKLTLRMRAAAVVADTSMAAEPIRRPVARGIP